MFSLKLFKHFYRFFKKMLKQCICFIWFGEVMVVKFIMEKPLWLEHQLHCPKNNLGCGLKTDPVMQRFVSGVLTHISGTKTFASAPPVTDSFFLRSFRFIFGTVYNNLCFCSNRGRLKFYTEIKIIFGTVPIMSRFVL